ncbi:transposase [Bradyrhizobium sp. USDA 10063]
MYKSGNSQLTFIKASQYGALESCHQSLKRSGQKWRTGCEGRISVAKRRHGLDRCRYKGRTGMKRWVGLGVVADNLMSIGRAMEERSTKT